MRTHLLVFAMILATGHAWAAPEGLYDAWAIDNSAITDPARAVKDAQGQWMAFQVPVMAESGPLN